MHAGGAFKTVAGRTQDSVGALMHYPNCGPISGAWHSTISVCPCQRPRCDLDLYGRRSIPNGSTVKVSVRDNTDTEIVRFRGYGNWDAQQPVEELTRRSVGAVESAFWCGAAALGCGFPAAGGGCPTSSTGCQGPKSPEPKPHIPLGWPIFAGASDRHIYVGDVLNHHVARVDKQCAAEAICGVK